jgi:hypothetical protein
LANGKPTQTALFFIDVIFGQEDNLPVSRMLSKLKQRFFLNVTTFLSANQFLIWPISLNFFAMPSAMAWNRRTKQQKP